MSSEVKQTPPTPESYRPLLFAIAYQMTGTAIEAEDLVQATTAEINAAMAKATHRRRLGPGRPRHHR